VPWDPCDLLTPSGIHVEVKSAAYVQSWHQNRLSDITFNIKACGGWDSATNVLDPIAKRRAVVYVFALLAHNDKASINPLDLSQWHFNVLPTSTLNARERSQHSITLKSLAMLCPEPVAFAALRDKIEAAAIKHKKADCEDIKVIR